MPRPGPSRRPTSSPFPSPALNLPLFSEIPLDIGKVGLCVAIVMLVVLVIKFLILGSIYGWPPGSEIASAIVGFFITSVTIVVVAVPEGLPMAVTLALAYATIQMLKDQNLVRVLAACETMGGATSTCAADADAKGLLGGVLTCATYRIHDRLSPPVATSRIP